jgi:hypothetical protein
MERKSFVFYESYFFAYKNLATFDKMSGLPPRFDLGE